MKHGSLFSGIGGFDLAAEWMGWENVFHCEWNPFGQRVLKHYWPNAKSYEDITQTDFTLHRGSIDILSGGFPCQPYSMAGKRKGKADERHLWPQMLRAIREIAPRYIVGENVLGLVNWDGGLVFDEVQADLESAGYEVAAVVIPAAAVNAPHGRDRVWFVAYNNGIIWGEGGKLKSREQSRYGKSNEKSNTTFNRLAQNTLHSGCIHGRNEQEGAGVRQQRHTCSGDTERVCGAEMAGLVADANCNGLVHGYFGSSKKQSNGRSKFIEHNENGSVGLTADTNSNGQHECNCDHEINTGEGRINAQCDTNTSNVDGDVTHTDFERFKQHNIATISNKKERFNNKENFGSGHKCWENFPTQSPICSGDDGLPTELDGITFSKWRNESIKAYGNAIVPQVAFEIFKAIQLCEPS